MIAEHPSRNLQAIPQWRPKGTTESFFRAGTARAIEPGISLSPPPAQIERAYSNLVNLGRTDPAFVPPDREPMR
jgi:hypothetical protein